MVSDRQTVKYLRPGYLEPLLDDSYGEDLELAVDEIHQGAAPGLCSQDFRLGEPTEYKSLVMPGLPSPDIRQQEAFLDIQAQVGCLEFGVLAASKVISARVQICDTQCAILVTLYYEVTRIVHYKL